MIDTNDRIDMMTAETFTFIARKDHEFAYGFAVTLEDLKRRLIAAFNEDRTESENWQIMILRDDKPVYVSFWCPEAASIREKMRQASDTERERFRALCSIVEVTVNEADAEVRAEERAREAQRFLEAERRALEGKRLAYEAAKRTVEEYERLNGGG